jgi:activating signal cointegrator complex subunit 2
VLPELGDGYVLKCLEALNGDADAVVNALLSDQPPKAVANLPRSTTLAQLANAALDARELTTGAAEIRQRMSVYGDDDFDVLGGGGKGAIAEGRMLLLLLLI